MTTVLSQLLRTLRSTRFGRLLPALLLGAAASLPVHAQSLFTTQVPDTPDASDGSAYELGMKFQVAKSGQITAIRYWKAPSETGAHVGTIWSASGAVLATANFAGETASGWQEQALTVPLAIQANTVYVVSVNANAFFALTINGLAGQVANGDISSVVGGNGAFAAPGTFPSSSFQDSNYFRDVVYIADPPAPPTKLSLTPTSTSSQSGVPVAYTATIQDANGNTVSTATNAITFSVSGVTGSFSPTSPVSPINGQATTNFTATSTGSATITASAAGLTSAAATLTVVAPPSAPGQTLLDGQIPAVPDTSDGTSYELGMKFQLAKSGQITAIRYWKAPSETGAHVGRIWSNNGTLLASVPFSGETASGWQQQALSAPLVVQPNTVYVVSVNAANAFGFTSGGLAAQVTSGDISSVLGGNGVYGNAGAFPTASFLDSNYFRDIVFVPDPPAPAAKLSLTPSSTSTLTGAPVVYTASIQDANGNTVTTATNAITFSVSGVSGSFSPTSPVSPINGVATSSLTATTTGTATITVSAAGLTDATATLTVAEAPVGTVQSLFGAQTPAVPNTSDGVPYELGMKFQVSKPGQITGIRYWKAASETGTHIGRIWSASGQLLASTTFTGETSSGWQHQTLTSPLVVQPNTIYVVSVNVVSFFAYSNGGLAAQVVNGNISTVVGDNGVFGSAGTFPTFSYQNSNYFRDVLFIAQAAGAPAKVSLTPVSSASQTGVPVTYTATIQDAAGNTVDTATNAITFSVNGVTGTFNPAAPVVASGGVATVTFSATTSGIATITASATGLVSGTATLNVAAAPPGSAQTLFTTQTPELGDTSDGVPFELGMKFRTTRPGQITAIRYWKAPSDTGTHEGRIWSSTGAVLASVTFTGETASGWQQQPLAAPLTISADTTYVVSVNVASNFAYTGAGLATQIVNGDIGSVADGNNGVFGPPGTFPQSSFQNGNYFRDIVFVAVAGTPTKLSLVPSSATTQLGVPVAYTATVQDAYGTPVTTATNDITFVATGVPGSFLPGPPVAAVGGAASWTFIPSGSGAATITASAAGLTGASAALIVTALPPEPPQSLFTTQTPDLANGADGVAYELGMKFRVANAGHLSAVRFWKSPSDGGTHVGRIWSANGTLLASATFTGETASGWQQQALTTPLEVQPNTTYIVSVNISSHYPYSANGLATSVTNGYITSVADGNNGVFGPAGEFPIFSYQNANYFRDIVFVPRSVGPPAKLGLLPGTGITQNGVPLSYTIVVQDADGNTVLNATNPISLGVSGVLGTFNPSSIEQPLIPTSGVVVSIFTPATTGTATISASSPDLVDATAQLTVVAQGAAVKLALIPQTATAGLGGTVNYTAIVQDLAGNTVTTATNAITFSLTGLAGVFSASPVTAVGGLAPTVLTPIGEGTGTVIASAPGLIGASAALTVTSLPSGSNNSLFTTQTPSSADATDGGASYELGMKFRLARSGRITAIRYWKSPSDTGTHIGRIWTSTGTLLAAAAFTNESASGWQSQSLSTPLTVQANTTYVVSVNVISHYPVSVGGLATSIVNGNVSSVADGNNGVYGTSGSYPTLSFNNSNYFRDVVFVADQVPTVTKVSGDNQSGPAGTVMPSPLVVLVRDANNNPMANSAVVFGVTTANGSLAPQVTTTDANGLAQTTLTLGQSGFVNVTATAAGASSLPFRAIITNPIYLENRQPGTAGWQMTNPVTPNAPEIAGFATASSVNKGSTLPFKIRLSQAGQYSIEVYRLGYYGGIGSRRMGTYGPFTGSTQSTCGITNAATRLIECNWSTSFTLQVGADWTSGLYIAKLIAQSSGKQSQIWFVVRDDSSTANVLFQSSLTTYLAYNNFGDTARHSLYEYGSTNGQRAYKVSLDRPFGAVTINPNEYNQMPIYEYHMVRWMESQGYDVTYVDNLDVHMNPSRLLQHKTFLSVGHDEYWSLEMRNAVEQARDAGVNLGFFSANTAYWRVRFEPSSSGQPNRVMVCYKDPLANDPVAPTYLWRGPQNNRPENALLGVMYVGDYGAQWEGFNWVVQNASDPYYANTGLTNGSVLFRLVGYEWDAVVNNGFTPPGVVVLSQSPTQPTEVPPLPVGVNGSISNAVRYTAASGAKVFSAGTIQLMWGLDSVGIQPSHEDARVRQFVTNVLSDLGAKPLTPDEGIVVP